MKKLLCAVSLCLVAGGAFADQRSAPASSVVSAVYHSDEASQVSGSMSKDPHLIKVYQFMRNDGAIVSNVCNTPVGSCMMAVYVPIVNSCWCPTPYGPVTGTPGG